MYPNPATPWAAQPHPPSAGTAETLILIGFILQLLGSVVIVIVFGFLGLFAGSLFLFGSVAGGVALLIVALLVVVPILLLYVAWEYSYRRTRDGNYAGARTPTLVLGIIGLFFGGIITGILYIIAYAKLGDAMSEMQQMRMGYAGYGGPPYPGGYPGMPGAYPAAPYGYAPAAPSLAPAPPPVAATCPKCGRPGTFVPQYNRSFCYTCQQYL